MTIPERVAAGAKWLDENVGLDWPTKVNLPKFDMVDPCRCVVGWVFKVESGPLTGFRFGANKAMDAGYSVVDLGFDIRGGSEEYQLLQDEWTKVIKERTKDGTK